MSRTWGPTRWGGAGAPYKCFRHGRKPWRRGGFADPEHHKLLTDTKKKDTTFVVSFFLEYPNTIDAKASRFAPLTKSKPNVVGSIWEGEARERADDVFCIKNVEAKRTLLRRGTPQHYRCKHLHVRKWVSKCRQRVKNTFAFLGFWGKASTPGKEGGWGPTLCSAINIVFARD